MNLDRVRQQLPIGQLGEPTHYFPSLGSTNDRAKELAEAGMASGGLVIADEQTAGRGRFERTWFTPPGSALALSVLLRDLDLEPSRIQGLNAVGALAVADAIEQLGGEPRIKWPNDVLLNGRKVAGILVEANWRGEHLEYLVIGIGVNVHPASIPPAKDLEFPATSVASEVGQEVSREKLLIDLLAALDLWLGQLGSQRLVSAWNDRLAFRDQVVEIEGRRKRVQGTLRGVTADGRIELDLASGERQLFGEDFVRLRRVDRNTG